MNLDIHLAQKKTNRPYFKLVFFKFYLKAIIPILLIQCLRFGFQGLDNVMLEVNFGMLLLSIASLMLVGRYFMATVIVYCSAWVFSFCVFWLNTNGISGPASYAYFAFFVVFTIILPVGFRFYFLIVFTFIALILTQFYPVGTVQHILDSGNNYYENLSVHYLLVSMFIGVTMIALKMKYEYEKNGQIIATRQLEELTGQLNVQRQKLNKQNQVYEKMTQDLESIVLERTLELTEKNNQLYQLAYDNAHFIRGPLCNIQGVLSLLLSDEKSKIEPKKLDDINEQANKLDVLTKEINIILK